MDSRRSWDKWQENEDSRENTCPNCANLESILRSRLNTLYPLKDAATALGMEHWHPIMADLEGIEKLLIEMLDILTKLLDE